jgi:CRISPR/Cas system endoribonuclease Cas6 (RAMP superfamily)
MQRKVDSISVSDAVEAKNVGSVIDKTRALDSEEEKVLRMRRGCKIGPKVLLERHRVATVSVDDQLQDELLFMEMKLLRAWRKHQAQNATSQQSSVTPVVNPVSSRTKEKIVRALRKRH